MVWTLCAQWVTCGTSHKGHLFIIANCDLYVQPAAYVQASVRALGARAP